MVLRGSFGHIFLRGEGYEQIDRFADGGIRR